MKRSRKKILLVFLVIAIIMITLMIISNINSKKTKSSIEDFRNVKEIVEYYNCKYLGRSNAKEEDYKSDINIIFSIPPIKEDGTSNQINYETIISAISAKMNDKNFRIVDENNGLIVRVKFNGNGNITYTINNDENFFGHLLSNYSIENAKEEKNIDFIINSNQINRLKSNGWRTTNISLGTIDSNIDKYDIYFDEGYKIRKINGRAYNIIFTKKYTQPVVNNLYVADTLEKVKQTLGQEIYSGKANFGEVIGYKSDDMYVYFSESEISIYPNESGKDSEQFASLVNNLIETNDKSEFLSKLTDIWPDYSMYYKSGEHIWISYPLKGIEIDFLLNGKSTITVYSNYKGKLTENIDIDDLKQNKIIPTSYINFKLNENFVSSNEILRKQGDTRGRHPYADEGTLRTAKYIVYLGNDRCSFYSINMEDIDSAIELQGLNNIYTLNDTMFVYSIAQNGIYIYDAITMNTTQIIKGTEDYKIRKIQNNIIYYDNKSIKVE